MCTIFTLLSSNESPLISSTLIVAQKADHEQNQTERQTMKPTSIILNAGRDPHDVTYLICQPINLIVGQMIRLEQLFDSSDKENIYSFFWGGVRYLLRGEYIG